MQGKEEEFHPSVSITHTEIGEMEAVGRTGVSVKKKLHKERETKMTL